MICFKVKNGVMRAFHEKEECVGWKKVGLFSFLYKEHPQYFYNSKLQTVHLSLPKNVYKNQKDFIPLPIGTTLVFTNIKGEELFFLKEEFGKYYLFSFLKGWVEIVSFLSFIFETNNRVKPVWRKGTNSEDFEGIFPFG